MAITAKPHLIMLPDDSPCAQGPPSAPGWFGGGQARLGIDVLFMAERLGLRAGAAATRLLAGQETSCQLRPPGPRRDCHDWPRENRASRPCTPGL